MLKLFKKMHSREWKMAGICALLIIGQIYFELRLPDYMSNLTVLIETPGSSMSEVYRTGAEMLACTLASAALSILCGYLVARIAGGFSYTIRELVFKKVADFGQKEMHTFSVPSLINRTTNDITQIQMFVAMGLQIMVKSPVMAVWAVLKIVNKSWTLSAITAGFVVALLLVMVLIIVIILPRVRRVQRMLDDINLVSRENLNGISVVHAYNAEDYQAEKFEKANDALTRTQLFNQRALAFLLPVVSFAMSALSLIIYWVGAAIINDVPLTDMTGRIAQFGDIVVFGTYATYVIMSIMMMVMIIMLLPSAQVSAGRINEVLDTEIELCEGDRTEAKETGTVEFRNVSFQYPSAGKNALENISFKVNKGETIAFIGATGSGKTTLVSLAARFYDATEGQVLIDGEDVRSYSFDALYDRIGYVTQKAVLFAGDIKNNVLFGESGAPQTDENVRESLDIAQATEFVDKLPKGTESPIVQGGTNVSGGQKQRLSIARALARKPEILIFDDSFSALDYRTDAKLRKALNSKLKGTTCMIVAQRIGTIRNADKIVVLEDGKAAGIGTHEELMKNCKVYQEIAMSQLSKEELGA
ncbi:MAG: ABC transporter ATP-binding protein [Marvinbryantia sp.]|uniref:ABC transporter ATP-binding protein n=1 Tax=Marvinbryantia sp. TaxID=2496532 RepID=UPI0025E6D330|nr:ABC transporter ATP-binding protein [uncultured Marvinbryantia sp.]